MGMAMKRAGAAVPSANRITLLRDADGDGIAETRSVFLKGLNSPFGMALVGHDFYVANTDAVDALPVFRTAQREITEPGVKVADLPAGRAQSPLDQGPDRQPRRRAALRHAWDRTATTARTASTRRSAAPRSSRSISPTASRACSRRGCAIRTDSAWEPQTGVLWTVVNERDELGNDLVPDYLTSVKDGAFYGWPYSYYGQHLDSRVTPQRPELVAKAIAPDYALGQPRRAARDGVLQQQS